MPTGTCVNCGNQLTKEGTTWIDHTGGDVCGMDGTNSPHVDILDTEGTKAMTVEQIWEHVNETAQDIIDDLDQDTARDYVIERCDEECDTLWGQLAKQGMVSDYSLRDMLDTVQESAAIIELAEEKDCVETDSGLWEGVTYGLVASIAYWSLRNLLYQALREKGVEINDDFPLFGRDPDDSDKN